MLALDRNIDGALSFSGTAVTNINCGVGSNSRSGEAVAIAGSAMVDVDYIEAHGDIEIIGSATVITDTPPKPYSNYIRDPYADLDIPPPSPCDETELLRLTGASVTLDPGRYCGGISLNGGDVTFNPGVYIIDAGDFLADGIATLTGTGVTFILTADDPADIGNVRFSGGTVADLIAPSDEGNPYAGVLFYQDRRATSFRGPNLVVNFLQGGADMDLQGAIYFPSQNITYTGGASSGAGCTQLIARGVKFSGNANLLNGEAECDALRVRSIVALRVALVE